jgi:hypothetical protein
MMPTASSPQPTPPTGDTRSSPSDPEFPLLQPDTEDEQDLAKGESELVFIAPPPPASSTE